MGVIQQRWMSVAAALLCACSALGADDARRAAHAESCARLLGYVRFFHANDGVWKSDWDALTVRAMEESLAAEDAGDLAARLNGLIGKVAPLVRVYEEGAVVPTRPTEAPSEGATAAYIAAWEHVGLRIGVRPPGAWYRSDRMGVSLTDPKAFERVPDPRTEIDESLGSGLRVAMPVSVLVDSKVRSMPPGAPYQGAEGARGLDDAAMRLAGAAAGWAALRHFSVIGNGRDVDWEAGLRDAIVGALESEAGLRRGLRALLARTGDGQGAAWSEGARAWRAGARLVWAEERVFVESVGEGSGGLRVGDEIVEVRGLPIGEAVERALAVSAGATEGARRARALDVVCEAVEGERIVWSVLRGSERETVETGAIEDVPAGLDVRSFENGVRVIRVGESMGDELIAAMDRLAGARGVVIDARNADAGVARAMGWVVDGVYLGAPEWSAVVMLPEWHSVRWRDETGEIGPKGARMGGAVALLTDARTVGSAEIGAVLMKGLKLGDLVGERTGGSAGRVVEARLPGGLWLRFTGTQARNYDTSPVVGVGVEPTIEVARTAEGMRAGRDEPLERAIESVLMRTGGTSGAGAPR